MRGAFADQLINLTRRLAGFGGQGAHLLGHHRKTAPCIPRAGRLDPSVQGQKIGLERNIINHTSDLGNAIRRLLDHFHRLCGIGHNPCPAGHLLAGFARNIGCGAGVLGRPLDGDSQLLHRGCGLLQRGRLRGGAPRQILCGAGHGFGFIHQLFH